MSRHYPAAAWRPSKLFRPLGHRWTRTVTTGAVALALAACGALPSSTGAAAGAGHGAAVASASATAPASASATAPASASATAPASASATAPASASATASASRAAAPPRFFADLVLGEQGGQSQLQVRESATGRLVAQDRSVLASGLAALADGRTFVIAEPVGQSCATRLYQVRLNGRGQPGALSPLPVPVLPGELYSLTASGNGHVLGYAISGCSKGDPGYIGVVHVPSGRTTRWGNMELGGVSPGNVGLNGELSLSANGRLLAFPAFRLSANSTITAQGVRVLHVDAEPGTVAQRSRIVRGSPYPPYRPLLASAVLSPGGRTLYTCTILRQARHAVRLAADHSGTGRLRRALATLAVTGPRPAADYCPIALDGLGRHLLVPYSIRFSRNPEVAPKLRIARVTISTGRVAILNVRLPAGGMQPADGLLIAW
jgi:hypothetical protein